MLMLQMPRFLSGHRELLHNSFFQDHETCYSNDLNKYFLPERGDQSIQYSRSASLTSHPSLTLLLQLHNREEVTGKN